MDHALLPGGHFISNAGKVWSYIETISNNSRYGNVILAGNGCNRRAIKIYKMEYRVEIFSLELLLMGATNKCMTRAEDMGVYTTLGGLKRTAVMMSTAISDLSHVNANYDPSQAMKKRMVYHMCCSLMQMHKLKMLYMDIKSANFLAFGNPNEMGAKLCDYSLALRLERNGTKRCGEVRMTQQFIPPEVIATTKLASASNTQVCYTYTEACDIWMFALVIANFFSVRDDLSAVDIRIHLLQVVSEFERPLQSLLMKMTHDNPNKRPSMEEVVRDSYFDDVRDSTCEVIQRSIEESDVPYDKGSDIAKCIERMGSTDDVIKMYSRHVHNNFAERYVAPMTNALSCTQQDARDLICIFCVCLGAEICNNGPYFLPYILSIAKSKMVLSNYIRSIAIGDIKLGTKSNSQGDAVESIYISFVKIVMSSHLDIDQPFSFFRD